MLFAAIGLVVILYQLPRSVVENDQLQEVSSNEHAFEIPERIKDNISQLRTSLKKEESFDKKINFAHSLAKIYLDYSVLDSAIKYAEDIESWENGRFEAADIYFRAFERSPSQDEGIKYAEKAKKMLQILSEKDPEDLFIKNRLAMTLVASENPMAGVLMLREIVEKDESNRQAILSLGLLAIQSGQFEKAKNRFETLMSLNSNDHEAKLYLAVSMIELKESAQARLALEEILASEDSIPAIKTMAGDYLEAL